MGGLPTINNLNDDKYVVSEYVGLHYVGYTAHTTEAEANAKALEIHQHPGKRASVAGPRILVDQSL